MSILDVLKDLPGVSVQEKSHATFFNSVSIRGFFGNDKFIILQDGIRINSPTNEKLPIGNNFPVLHAKQVEIVYGPASALYGADAFNGVINIITEDAKNIDGVNIMVSGGEFGSKSVSLNGGIKMSDSISVVAGGYFQQSDNPDLTKYYPEEFKFGDLVTLGGTTVVSQNNREPYNGDTDSYSIYTKVKILDDFTVGFNQSQHTFLTSVGARPNSATFSEDAKWITLLRSLYGKYDFKISKQLTGLLQASYADYGLDPDSKFQNIFTNFSDGFKYSEGDKKQIELQVDYAINEQNKMITGITYEKYHSIPKTADLPQKYNNNLSVNNQGLFYPSNTDLPVKIFETEYDNIGAFVQWKRNWTETLASTLGIRYDDSSTYGESINPRIGVVYKPSQTTTTKLLYGSAFLAPSPVKQFDHFGSFAFKQGNGIYKSFFFHIPNAEIKPETIDTIELNISHAASKNLNISSVIFYSKVDDLIAIRPTTIVESGFIPGGDIAATEENANIGKASAFGIDLWLDYLQSYQGFTLTYWGNYSYLDGELEQDNLGFKTNLPYTTKHQTKFGLTFNYQGKYIISPSIRWIDKTNALQPVSNELPLVPAYTLVNLHASAKVHDNFEFFLHVDNVFDERFYNAAAGGVESFINSPQDPRKITAGLKLNL